MKLWELVEKRKTVNNGTRTLFESAMVPELVSALKDWRNAANANCVLIGGLGLSYYIRPRVTQDIDFLFFSDADIPAAITGFKRTWRHAFQHNATHVEIELVTPELVNVPKDVIQQVFDTAVASNGIKVASASGLVAMKLFRLSLQDRADIVALIKSGHVDMTGFNLPRDKQNSFDELFEQAKTDPHPG